MFRTATQPRENYTQKLENLNFSFHQEYWNEEAYYEFTSEEIDQLEATTSELYQRCIDAVDWIIQNKFYQPYNLTPTAISLIENSWIIDAPSLYGRFDLWYDGVHKPPKLFEFNAETPTAIYEAAVIQWFWLQDTFPNADQFNSIHDKLLNAWQWFKNQGHTTIHFTAMPDY